MKDLRFKWVVISSIFLVPWAVPWANYMNAHKDKYSVERRYKHAMLIVNSLRRRSFTKTTYYGTENLPKDEPFVIYSNHQGKYDALGIMLGVNRPLCVLWERKKAEKLLAQQVAELCDAELIDLQDPRDIVNAMKNVVEKTKQGRSFLIFPEGGYEFENGNEMQEFKTGCFSASIQAKGLIVPVCIWDSYKGMNGNSFKPVKTEVHFLPVIRPEEYDGLKKQELCDLVRLRIAEKLDEIKMQKA